MRSNWLLRTSTRLRLLAFLLPVLALETGAGLWLTRVDAVASANAAYDRSLLGAIKGLDLNVSTASGGLAVEQPYALCEFFQLAGNGPVHFRVATDDGLVEIGTPELPLPPHPLRAGEPQFYDAEHFGEPVRVGLGLARIAAQDDPHPDSGGGEPAEQGADQPVEERVESVCFERGGGVGGVE